jgi:hypothetical protein
MGDAQSGLTSEVFMRSHGLLSDGRQGVRERIQEITAQRMRTIVNKLEGPDSLSGEDIACVKLWIVGDAESYTLMENNFQGWLNEFERLRGVLAAYANKNLSPEDLAKLQGILEDALRVSADIANFLEKKERIKKFNEAIQDSASLDREILKHILESKLKSSQM